MLEQYYSWILFSQLLTPTTASKSSMIFLPFLRLQTYKCCKYAVFNLHNSFIEGAFALFFIKLICFREFLLCISTGVRIKHLYLENILSSL